MKKNDMGFLSLAVALTVLCSCGAGAENGDDAGNEGTFVSAVTTASETLSSDSGSGGAVQEETEAAETEAAAAVPEQNEDSSSVAAADEGTVPQKPVIDEAAISSARSQLTGSEIIARKDTVRYYYPFPTKKCTLYITSSGDYYAAYYEREEIENDDRFWLADAAETPQTIGETEGAEYLGTLSDEELSELLDHTLSVDPDAERYEHLRGEDETAPAVNRKTYDIYTFMIWDENHERTVYTAFVFSNPDYYLNSSDECASAAVTIIDHGDIESDFSGYYYKRLDGV
ncbi:MAG: hypothetical protein IJ737_06450 [Ruminococcus sp.]|nr:hypothetical protein [Ruminococcus sp.]